MSTVLTQGGNAPLTAARVTVEVTAPKALDVSGLLLTDAGKVRSDADFVFFNAPHGPGVSLRPASAGAPDAITVDTPAVPADISKVVITASPADQSATFAGMEPTATLRDADTDEVLVTFTPPRLGLETALIVVEVYRRNGVWKVRAVGQGYADGLAGIATDFGVTVDDSPAPTPQPAPTEAPAPASASPSAPTVQIHSTSEVAPPAPPLPATPPLPPVPPAPPAPPVDPRIALATVPSMPTMPTMPTTPPAPAAPAAAPEPAERPKVTLDKGRVSLVKGSSVSLVKNGRPFLSSVRMALGWESAARGRDIDLDASCLAFDARHQRLETAWFMKLTVFNGAIAHSGDNLVGGDGGDDEAITVHLEGLPAEVHALVFVVNSFSGQKFTELRNAYCRLVDVRTEEELVRFDLTQSEPRTGVVMCKLVRRPSGEWEMTALGEFVDGKTARAMIEPSAALL
ncbi:TerD family protein [Kitasatospora aureofaciens]|uniref:Transport-associated protein n=1 Tax=Kitasatospora aureofaciens TaxID=1894 RepID=A0A8H9HR04_KITAU|nr:TerD family protein [Kitasatospora aureofaciens]GGU80671.1 transport-associated protein [Kitasatospora aureofaciens]